MNKRNAQFIRCDSVALLFYQYRQVSLGFMSSCWSKLSARTSCHCGCAVTIYYTVQINNDDDDEW